MYKRQAKQFPGKGGIGITGSDIARSAVNNAKRHFSSTGILESCPNLEHAMAATSPKVNRHRCHHRVQDVEGGKVTASQINHMDIVAYPGSCLLYTSKSLPHD